MFSHHSITFTALAEVEFKRKVIKRFHVRQKIKQTVTYYYNVLQAEKILQHFLLLVQTYDIDSLRSYWNHFETRIFCRFDQLQLNTVKKMEYNLYKFYLVNCIQNGRRKDCLEFFEKYSQVSKKL